MEENLIRRVLLGMSSKGREREKEMRCESDDAFIVHSLDF